MADDLERFLQQAAQKLKEKVQQGQAPQQPAQRQRPPQLPPSVRKAERRPRPTPAGGEIIEAQVISDDRSKGPNPLSNIDTRRPLAQTIDQADERMSGHLHDVFDHAVSSMTSASSALHSNVGHSANQTTDAVEVDRREQISSPFLRMLRQPDTLRAAFIASEIFQRKF
jgi:hypothetical protein